MNLTAPAPPGHARRIATRAFFLLAIGALLNTAVAAACLLYVPVKNRVTGVGVGTSDIPAAMPDAANFKPSSMSSGLGIITRMDYWYWVSGRSLGAVGVTSSEAGWPLRAFASPPPPFATVHTPSEFTAAAASTSTESTTSDLPALLHAQPYRKFPTAVRPLAFAVNTAVYAALSGAGLYGWAAVRASRRRRADRCVPCGYELAGLPQCPECGSLARVLAALGTTFGLLVVGGCTVNCAPLHSDLSMEELSARVSQRFHKGMCSEEVRTQLDRADLHHSDGEVPPRWILSKPEAGIIATVRLEHVAYGPGFSVLPTGHRRMQLGPEAAP